jgi:hypothetical protein
MFLRPHSVDKWLRKRAPDTSYTAMDPKGVSTRARGIILMFVGAGLLPVTVTQRVPS